MLTTRELESLWLQTEVPLDAGATAVCATGLTVEDADVVVGRDHLGRRHLMVPLAAGEDLSVRLRAAGLRANAPRELLQEGARRHYLDLYCTRHELHGIFGRLAQEVVAEAARPGPNAARRCANLLEEWRSLFGTGVGAFGRDQAVGLLGELWLLRRVLLLDSALLDTWTGPLGGVHDFRRGTAAIEVKTTLRTHGLFHSISSVEQLAPPPGGKLGFLSLKLEAVPEGTMSISSLLGEIRAIAAPAALARLLDEAGFVEGAAPELEAERFEIREARFYEVGADFPRIVPATLAGGRLPPGVITLGYEIELSVEPPVPLGEEAANRWLKEFACRL